MLSDPATSGWTGLNQGTTGSRMSWGKVALRSGEERHATTRWHLRADTIESMTSATAGTGEHGAVRSVLGRYVPITDWLPRYPRAWLGKDIAAGITSWAVMVPVAMAYAELAGVPAGVGLVTATAGLTAYAVLGTSRHAKVTTSSTMAVMSASVVAPAAGGDAATYVAMTAMLAIIVGLYLIAAGILKLGFLAEFLAKPVITGFIVGLAITIAVGQLPKLFGVPGTDGNVIDQLVHFVGELPETNLISLALGLGGHGHHHRGRAASTGASPVRSSRSSAPSCSRRPSTCPARAWPWSATSPADCPLRACPRSASAT